MNYKEQIAFNNQCIRLRYTATKNCLPSEIWGHFRKICWLIRENCELAKQMNKKVNVRVTLSSHFKQKARELEELMQDDWRVDCLVQEAKYNLI